MVKPELYNEIINQLSNMDSSQLKELVTLAQETHDRRKNIFKYFKYLVDTLEETLRTINAEFPDATIPLVISPTETIDLMDYIIPADFADKCQMGEIYNEKP